MWPQHLGIRHVAFLILLCPTLATAQDRVVRGVVLDSAGKGVPFAVVTETASERSVQADENGRFRLQLEFSSGKCAVWVRRIGFHSATINLEACPDTALRIVLARAPREESGPRCGTRSTAPCVAPGAPGFFSISAGQTHSCALERDGTAWCWGDGRKAAAGDGTTAVHRWPRRVETELRFRQIATGGSATCGVIAGGAVSCWGTSEVVPSWPKPAGRPREVGSFGTGASLTIGRRHACVLDANGRASCWGWNVDGETGTGTSGIASSLVATPTPVVGDHRFVSISAGFDFTCGVTSEGQVQCWGSNVDGVLGDQAAERCGDVESVPCSSRPVPVNVPEPMRQVSSGTSHVCAAAVSGAVYCWGANGNGQLGQVGPTTRTPQRVSFTGAGKVATVASGGIESCALTTAGTLYCWGADYRRPRIASLSNEDVAPRLVAGGIRAVSLGQLHACAVTNSAVVQCWGDTIMGAFGVR